MHARFDDLLAAAERLLEARENQMLTKEEWAALESAVSALQEPEDRSEFFEVDASRSLVRSVTPKKGDPYQHRCSEDSYTAFAHSVAEATGPFTLEDLRGDLPWSQAAVAFAFLKERGIVIPTNGRMHIAAGSTPFEDAMVVFHALRAKRPADKAFHPA